MRRPSTGIDAVIGSTQLTYTKGVGEFHCPACDASQPYRHRRKREFLTVYFIPIVPLQMVAEFVECTNCRQSFDVDVVHLTADEIRRSEKRKVMELIRRALVVIVAADQRVTDEELATVERFAQRFDLPEVSRELVLREADSVRRAQMDWSSYVHGIADQLGEEDKDLLIHHAFLAATADGALSDNRQTLLAELPDAIGVPQWRFREVIAQAAERP